MALNVATTIVGFFDGSREFETPGVLIDAETKDPFVFGINPQAWTQTKEMNIIDNVIPGRHAPLQEAVSGGAEVISLRLVFIGYSALGMAANKQSIQWLESLAFPDFGGIDSFTGEVAAAVDVGVTADKNLSGGVGHDVLLTYGGWIVNRRYKVRRIETTHGRSKHPILNIPYRLEVALTMQEAEQDNIDYLDRRYGLPSFKGFKFNS